MQRLRGKSRQALFQENSRNETSNAPPVSHEIKKLENEVKQWHNQINSRTRHADLKLTSKEKEVFFSMKL